MTDKTGHCMCGAVGFTASDVPEKLGACHCEMCRRWTGSAFVNIEVPNEKINWTGKEHIATLQSSDWAERGWCSCCGTGLFWRMTEENEYSGTTDIALGLFDDPSGFKISHEIYIDHKPDSFAFVDHGQTKLTRAECVAKFPQLDSDAQTSSTDGDAE
jgi:hypothetical protein